MLQRFTSDRLQRSPVTRLRSSLAFLLLCFFLVFTQSAALIHHHDESLQRQFDCDICLKVNATDHAVVSSQFDFVIDSGAPQLETAQSSVTALVIPSFRARAPPALG